MTLSKSLFVIGCLFAATVAWNLLPTTIHAGAEPSKGRQQWEYGTLTQVFPTAPAAYRLIWRTGKKRMAAESRTALEGVSKLRKDLGGDVLGGNDEVPPFGALLDRIGQDGWELVTYMPEPGPEGNTQTFTFKRPVP